MRILPAFLLATIITAPAMAQEKTTLQHMVEKGIVVKFPGIDLDIFYRADGSYSAMGGTIIGKWRIAGETLCAQGPKDLAEACTFYPAGKKPGDEFDVDGPQGAVTILINK